jgi:hypothetical protein
MSRGLLSNARLSALALCATGLLQACGGGGGGGGSSDGGGSSSSGASSGGVTPHAWVHEAYLKAANTDAHDGFGHAVAVSGDTLVVGSGESSNQTTITNGPTASSDNSAAGSGAVYIYKRTGTTWVQQAYLKASNVEAGDAFGASVAIDGDTVVVGALDESSNQTTITNGATASSDNSAGFAGAAYVFVRNGDTWAQQAYLKAHNAGHSDQFGASVAISGNTIVVGAYKEDSEQNFVSNGPTGGYDNPLYTSGAAYVFTRSGTTWTEQAYLKASNNRADYYPRYFGMSVAIDGDTIVVGAEGESSAQTTVTNGNTASDDRSAQNAGAVYVFVRSGVDWSQQAYLKASNAEASDFFGGSVAISGDTIVVGADGESSNQTTITNGDTASADNSQVSAGAAYVFTRTGDQWAQQAYLKAASVGPDGFGYAVAISGDSIVVGAFGDSSNQTTITNGSGASSNNSANSSGAAYVFKRTSGQWAQQAYLKAPNTNPEALYDDPGDQFGYSVAIDANTIVVGARYEDSNQRTITNGSAASPDQSSSDAGATYAYRYYP